jgi:hypothetical protein
VFAGDLSIIVDFSGVQRKNKLPSPVWDADFLKEYIIIFKKNDVLWTATQMEL